MNAVWEWLRGKMIPTRDESSEVHQARLLARRIAERADEVNEHLQKYHRSRDPFAAFMADLYNRDQLTRLHKGPRP